jgi:predicted transcriptional regulator
MDNLIKVIHSNPDLPETKLIALFARMTGLTLSKIIEYLYELEEGGFMERRDGKIKWLAG